MKKTRRSRSKFHEFVLTVEKYNIEITVPVFCDKQGSFINNFFTECVCVNPPSGEAFTVDRIEGTDIVLLREMLVKAIKDKTRKDLVFSFYEGPVNKHPLTRYLRDYFADGNRPTFDLENENSYWRIYSLLNVQDLRYLAVDENGKVYQKDSALSSMQQQVNIDINKYTKINSRDLRRKVEKLLTLLTDFVNDTDKVVKQLYEKVNNLSTDVSDSETLADTDLTAILKKYQ